MTRLLFKPPVIAHRGANHYAPENTMPAFTKAALLGIKWIEFDVMQSNDGVPVIFHDEELDRTTNAHGLLSDYSYAYLRSLDTGRWFNPAYAGEKIPSLGEMLQFLENTHLSANIEIKALPGQEEALVKRVLAQMSDYLKSGCSTILFSSFSLDALHYLRQYSSDCLLGLLMHEWHPDWKAICQSLECVSVHVNNDILDEKMANEIKAANKTLLCYTVNDPLRAEVLFSFGVDAVFSDVPDKILKEGRKLHVTQNN